MSRIQCEAEKAKEETDGYINFFRCGIIKNMPLNLFFDKVKCVFPDEISNIESDYINDASYGALTYWERHKGTFYCYDKNPQYPYLLSRNYHKFPIKEGEFKFINTIEDKPLYGVYRCIITKPDRDTDFQSCRATPAQQGSSCNDPYKFFRFNNKNYYTHFDIEVAIRSGLKVELIIDENANFLYYSDDKLLNGAFMFKHFVDDLYELKANKIKGVKEVLNILWGALCEMNIHKRNVDFNTEIDLSDYKLLSFGGNEDIFNFKLLPKRTKQFKTNWARIKPFILAYGRISMYHVYNKYEDLIIRINTDGIWLKEQPKELHEQATDKQTNWKLGYLKCEGEREIDLMGLNKGLNKK